MKDMKWGDRSVSVHECWLSAVDTWEFPGSEYRPWLCPTENGMEVVVTDWSISPDGSWEPLVVGFKFDDLIDGLIETFMGSDADPEEVEASRASVIAALTRATTAIMGAETFAAKT